VDDELKRLIGQAASRRFDADAWLVVADRLSDAGNPLGEYIVRIVQGGESSLRLEELGADWQARFAPWAQFRRWTMRQGIVLVAEDAMAFLGRAAELRELTLPLTLRADDDACAFDERFERFATVGVDRPSRDERFDLRIWRVADRALLVDRRRLAGDLSHEHSLEFRADGLYAACDTRMYPDVCLWRF
jgi:hypothetical protein